MAKLILGITGEMVSGKGTVAKHVVDTYQGASHRFSTILRDILDRVYVEQSRENMQNLSSALRKTFGEDVLAQSITHDVENDLHDVVVIDGIRRLPDIKYLKELPHFKLVYIETDMQIKYERLLKRGENIDDKSKTLEQFRKDHEGEAETQIRDLKNYANYVVENNDSFAKLFEQIDEIVKSNLQ